MLFRSRVKYLGGSDMGVYVGFEVEKSLFEGNARAELMGCGESKGLFYSGGAEHCGTEYRSNILPVLQCRNKREGILESSMGAFERTILNFPVDASCGGHVHISGLPRVMLEKLGETLYCLWPKRVLNGYAGNGFSSYLFNKTGSGGGIETKVPGEVVDIEDFVARYHFFSSALLDIIEGGKIKDESIAYLMEPARFRKIEKAFKKYKEIEAVTTFVEEALA